MNRQSEEQREKRPGYDSYYGVGSPFFSLKQRGHHLSWSIGQLNSAPVPHQMPDVGRLGRPFSSEIEGPHEMIL